MAGIINPFAEKKAREKKLARQMDIVNLARNLVITSAGSDGDSLFEPSAAFDVAEKFKAEEEKRFPEDITDE